jgi:hypothetical protein
MLRLQPANLSLRPVQTSRICTHYGERSGRRRRGLAARAGHLHEGARQLEGLGTPPGPERGRLENQQKNTQAQAHR